MPDIRQETFAGGEIAPTLYGRRDLTKYDNSLRRQRNCIVSPHGAILNRSGTIFVHEVKTSSKKVRLVPFVFSTDQAFVLEFGDAYLRFYYQGGIVITGGWPYEIVTPYAEADLPKLKFSQMGDVITIVHPGYAPRELKRLANDNWTISTVSLARPSAPTWQAGPFVVAGGDPCSNSLNYNAATTYQGGYTCRAGGTPHTYRSLQDNNIGHDPTTTIGSWWSDEGTPTSSLNHLDTPNRPAMNWEWVVTSVKAGVESLPSSALSPDIDTGNPNNNERINLHSDRQIGVFWSFVADATYYKIYRGRNGIFGYVGEASGTTVFMDDGSPPDYSDTPPTANNPFPGANDYPSVVAYFQQRRWFGGTYNNPQTIWGSKIGDYYNFDKAQIPKDDDSVQFTLASQQLEMIRNLLGLRVLLTMTQAGEWALAGSQGGPITPFSIEAKPQSYRGSSYLAPLSVGNVALYIQQMTNTVRELIFNLGTDSFEGNDITILSRHLFSSYSITNWAFAPTPYSMLWATRSDGKLLGCTYLREHELIAWGWHDTADTDLFEDVCCVPGASGLEHDVYVVVKRLINGSWKRYVERFASREIIPRNTDGTLDVRLAVFVDSALSYNGAAATVFTGLDHLEGRTVKGLADGNVIGPYVVSSGQVDVSDAVPDGAEKVVLGLSYQAEIETLDLKVRGINIQPNLKQVTGVNFEVIDTRGLWFGPDFDHLKEWRQRAVADAYGAVPTFSGSDSVNIIGAYSREGRVVVRQVDPLPMTILSLGREVDVGGD